MKHVESYMTLIAAINGLFAPQKDTPPTPHHAFPVDELSSQFLQRTPLDFGELTAGPFVTHNVTVDEIFGNVKKEDRLSICFFVSRTELS
jgi:hypothetical protein